MAKPNSSCPAPARTKATHNSPGHCSGETLNFFSVCYAGGEGRQRYYAPMEDDSERHLSRTDNHTLIRPKVSTAGLHANRIPRQIFALPGNQQHPFCTYQGTFPEAIPFGLKHQITRKGTRGRDCFHGFR